MAVRTQITSRGAELLATSSTASGQNWWIGWFALAYVPPEIKDEEGELPTASMTKLTTKGDMIYNIFQGDMNGEGFVKQSANSNFGIVNYDSNIKKNYRYVMDSTGRNNLVTWVDSPSGMKGAYVYKGIDVSISDVDNSVSIDESGIPLPAPLFYAGEEASLEGFTESGMSKFLNMNASDAAYHFYPSDEGNITDDTTGEIPRISTDFRKYNVYRSGITKPGQYASKYSGNLPCTKVIDGSAMDHDGWFGSSETYSQDGDNNLSNEYNAYCKEYWKALSISNFNKYCAPVNSIGLAYNEDAGCRNMAKTTKYFPIYSYNVINTKEYGTHEYATSIKLGIKLNITTREMLDEPYFDASMSDDGSGNVEYLNKSFSDIKDSGGNQIFSSNTVSFKFNRMGIYAVPMRQYGCSNDNVKQAQYQIDTEKEPVLFAICDWDSANTLSDSGDGLSTFETDVCIDLSLAVDESAIIRETALFYNLYEDDSIEWYKNQLLANASMSEALTNMQVELGYLNNKLSKATGDCCTDGVDYSQFALKNHTHKMLKNLVDADDYNDNGVRNINSVPEGTATVTLAGKGSISGKYTLGHDSYSLGENTLTAGAHSLNEGCGSSVDADSSYVAILADENSMVKSGKKIYLINSARNFISKSSYIALMNASDNDITDNNDTSMLIHGSHNKVSGVSNGNGTFINGDYNEMSSIGEEHSGTFVNGNDHKMTSGGYIINSIMSGTSSRIYGNAYVRDSIINGSTHSIYNSAYIKNSVISGEGNVIRDNSYIYNSAVYGRNFTMNAGSYIKNSSVNGSNVTTSDKFSGNNVHVYGSAQGFNGDRNNIFVFGADEDTMVGYSSAKSYSSSWLMWCMRNYTAYPTIFSEGGIGLYGRRIVLGDLDGREAKPHVGDSLIVESTDGDTAVVNWGKNTVVSSLSMQYFYNVNSIHTATEKGYSPDDSFRANQGYEDYLWNQNFTSVSEGIATFIVNINGSVWCKYISDGHTYTHQFPDLTGVLYIVREPDSKITSKQTLAWTAFEINGTPGVVYTNEFHETVKLTAPIDEFVAGGFVSEYIQLKIKPDEDSTKYIYSYAINGVAEYDRHDCGITMFQQGVVPEVEDTAASSTDSSSSS